MLTNGLFDRYGYLQNQILHKKIKKGYENSVRIPRK